MSVFTYLWFFSLFSHSTEKDMLINSTGLTWSSMICTKVDQQKHQLFNFIILASQFGVNWRNIVLLETLWPIVGPTCSQQAWEMSWNVWNYRNLKRQLILPLWSVCACLQHYIAPSFSSLSKMSLSPLDVYIRHKKPIVQILNKGNVHYKCNITVLNLTVLYYFCVIKCSPDYSNFTKEIVNHVLFTCGSWKCC